MAIVNNNKTYESKNPTGKGKYVIKVIGSSQSLIKQA